MASDFLSLGVRGEALVLRLELTPKFPFFNAIIQSSCSACGSITSSGKRCSCSRSFDENDHLDDRLILHDSHAIKGKKKRLKATTPTRQTDDETVRTAIDLETISAIPAHDGSNAYDQSSTILHRTRDVSKLTSDVSEGEASEDGNIKRLVHKTFDVMDKVLTPGIPKSTLPNKRSVHSILDPASVAQQILTNVSAQLKHLLNCADAAETRIRSMAEEQQSKLKTAQNEKDILVGTTFRKHFDSLGEFEGVVVALPTSNNPLYQVEYEDGGSESLPYESLVALLGPEHEPAVNVSTKSTADEESQSQNLLEEQIQGAREDAVEEACQRLLSGKAVE